MLEVATPMHHIIAGNERISFFNKHFGRSCVMVESALYGFAGKLCADYKGATWEFAVASNGAAFCFPRTTNPDQKFHCVWADNYSDETVDALTFGVVVSLFAINYAANRMGDDKVVDAYHALREYVQYLPMAEAINRLID